MTDKKKIRYGGEPTYNIKYLPAKENERYQGIVNETIVNRFDVVTGIEGPRISTEEGGAFVSFKPIEVKTRLLKDEYFVWGTIHDQIEGIGKGTIEKVDNLRSRLIFKKSKRIDIKLIKKPSPQWDIVQEFIMRPRS